MTDTLNKMETKFRKEEPDKRSYFKSNTTLHQDEVNKNKRRQKSRAKNKLARKARRK